MQARKLFLRPLLFLSIGLTSCGQLVPSSDSPLDGNWHIAGEQGNRILPPLQSPLLTFAIGMSGNTVYANGNVEVICSNGSSAIGGGMQLTGQIASDGTFLLSNSAFPLDSIQITIKGKVPAAGSTTWTGSYTVTNAPTEIGCTFNLSNNFVASLYPPLDGTYSGTITGPGLGSGISVTLEIAQGAFASATLSPSLRTIFYTPLSATTTVSGSSSFTSGTTTASKLPPGSSSIGGNAFELTFLMNNGSTLTFFGYFTDSSESTLQIEGPLSISSSAFGSGTLTRQ